MNQEKLLKRIGELDLELNAAISDYQSAAEFLGSRGFYGSSFGRLSGQTTDSLYQKVQSLRTRIEDLKCLVEDNGDESKGGKI
jgi:hypothetical protein